jgi:formylglycine-generating enzyme required for sulfatase activity
MGSPDNEPGRDNDEKQHLVTLSKGFYMQTCETTQEQWKRIMNSNPSYFKDCGGDCPVESVSWQDVQAFIKQLNQKEGKQYSLPTEAQWEYAARAGSSTAFANGKITDTGCSDKNMDAMGWYCGNAVGKTYPVGRKQKNDWGLYDMHGNVWEWCSDWHGSYPDGSVTDPAGLPDGSIRTIRGGSWINGAWFCRSAYRFRYGPGGRSGGLGFRLVLPPGQ